jgi:hypothetical protein
MTTVLGWDAPDVDPLAATRLIDLGVDYWIDRAIARLLAPERAPAGDRHLAMLIARIGDTRTYLDVLRSLIERNARVRGPIEWQMYAAALPADATPVPALADAMQPVFERLWRTVEQHFGDKELGRESTVRIQDTPAKDQVGLLALARQGLRKLVAPDAPVPLAAPLVPAPGRPTDGWGTIDVFEIGEPTHAFCWQGHEAARARLGDRVRWHWLHGPSHEHAQSFPTCAVIEAAIDQEPGGLWPHALPLLKHALHWRLGEFAEILPRLHWPSDPQRALLDATLEPIRARVLRDAWLLDAVGVPEIRPAFVVGRRLFAGRDAYDDLAGEVARRGGGAP